MIPISMHGEHPLQVHCIPRPGKRGSPRPVYEVSSKFAFHHANAWDTDNGTTIVVRAPAPLTAHESCNSCGACQFPLHADCLSSMALSAKHQPLISTPQQTKQATTVRLMQSSHTSCGPQELLDTAASVE